MSTNQVVLLFVDLAIIVALARLAGMAAKRLQQPAVIGEILAGVLVGPTLLGDDLTVAVFPMDVRPLLDSLANVGIAVFMFCVGAELNRRGLRGQGKLAASVSLGSIALPFALGGALAFYLSYDRAPGNRLAFILFLGVAMSVTAFPVLARIVSDRGLSDTRVGRLALTSAAADDFLAWLLLAVVVAISGGGADTWLFVFGPVYLAAMMWVVRPVLKRVITPDRPVHNLLPVLVAGLFLSGAITELIGLHYIFGAFLFGVVVPREGTAEIREAVLTHMKDLNAALLLPVFFVSAGLKVDLSMLRASDLLVLLLVLVTAVSGKFSGAYAAARLNRLPPRESAAIGVLMNTRGLTELIVLTVGLQLGVLDTKLFSIMVVMAIVTTAMAGPLLRVLYPNTVEEVRQGQSVGQPLADMPARPTGQ